MNKVKITISVVEKYLGKKVRINGQKQVYICSDIDAYGNVVLLNPYSNINIYPFGVTSRYLYSIINDQYYDKYDWTTSDISNIHLASRVYPNTKLFRLIYPNSRVLGNLLEVDYE